MMMIQDPEITPLESGCARERMTGSPRSGWLAAMYQLNIDLLSDRHIHVA